MRTFLKEIVIPQWDARQYLKFAEERTRPCRELAARIQASSPRQIVDLGCGPGNSTKVLADRWPDARLTGVDSSAEMIAAARRGWSASGSVAPRFEVGDISRWSAGAEGPFDIIFSNAALQWVPDHAALFPHLVQQLSPNGALAVQVPCNFDAPPHRLARELVASAEWKDFFPPEGVREWHVHDAAFYYDALAPHAVRVDLWETEYVQVMADVAEIVEWYKGTGLRPFLEALPQELDRKRFLTAYHSGLQNAYPARVDGRVLFPFRRLFLIACRSR